MIVLSNNGRIPILGYMNDTLTLLQSAILDEENFVKATLSGQQRGQPIRWQRCLIRPVLLKNGRHLQFSFFDQTQNITKNYAGEEAAQQVAEVLALPFRNFHVQTGTETIQVNLTKKGKAIVKRTEMETAVSPNLAHDRPKNTLLNEGDDLPFLRALGMMRGDGRIKANKRSKFNQINAFLALLADIEEIAHLPEPVRLVDFGCGSGWLTFAAYYYLHTILGKVVHIMGVDRKRDLMEKNQAIADELGWQNLTFVTGEIAEFQTDSPPHIVVALHACDTASDDAIAQAVLWRTPIILVAPCCHHHLQVQLKEQETPAAFAPVMRYGMLHERMGDVLTDSFRALILRMMGYRVAMMEFVDPDHTPKNLLLRAVQAGDAGHGQSAAEYKELRAYWQVNPCLHQLLDAELEAVLQDG
jgi:SAM-dependent methyltransferase